MSRSLFWIWFANALIGLMLVSFIERPSWQALGLGMMLPGGGFLLGSNWWLAGLSLFLFLGCSIVDQINGNVMPALLLWLGTAFWAADHAMTVGTCELLKFFDYFYVFEIWPKALQVIPAVVGTALCAAYFLRKS